MVRFTAFVAFIVILIHPHTGFGQLVQAQFIYINDGVNIPLTDGCGSGESFPDGHSISIYWDRTYNGPDSTDQLIELGSGYAQGNAYAFPFNAVSNGIDAGYFVIASLVILQPPNNTPGNRSAYFLRISGVNACWISASYLLSPGNTEWFLTNEDWTCSEQACITGTLPEPPLSVSASDDEYCLFIKSNWNHSNQNISGYCVYLDDVLMRYNPAMIDSTNLRVPDTQAHMISVTALNERGQSVPVSDQGSAYLRRFVPGPNGDVVGIRDPGEQITLEVDIPFGSCPAATWLYLMVDNAIHSELVSYLDPDSAFLNNLACTLPSSSQPLENCRIMLKDSSWDFGVVFYDTTASYFSISGQDARENDSYHAESFELLPAYPNPFNSTVSIPFIISKESRVSVEIVNLTGQVVAELANHTFAAGTHTLTWHGQSAGGRTLASGIYFCRLNSNNLTDTRKIILMK